MPALSLASAFVTSALRHGSRLKARIDSDTGGIVIDLFDVVDPAGARLTLSSWGFEDDPGPVGPELRMRLLSSSSCGRGDMLVRAWRGSTATG